MTNERHHELSQQLHEAIAAGDEKRENGLRLTLELEMAECLAHQSERGKESLEILKSLSRHSDERDDQIERKLDAHINEYEHTKARIEGAKTGANFTLTLIKAILKLLTIGGTAGATAMALQAFTN